MPIYEYECTECGKVEEAIQKFSDRPLTKCSHCSGKLHKLVSHSSFHLKGTGWYVTDYAGKSGSAARSEKKAESSSAETSGKSEKASSSEAQKSTEKKV